MCQDFALHAQAITYIGFALIEFRRKSLNILRAQAQHMNALSMTLILDTGNLSLSDLLLSYYRICLLSVN